MRAIVIRQFGDAGVLHLEDFPIPEPASGEVLIKVFASGVNPVDWKIRAGLRKEKFPVSFPLIPGWDVSGVVYKVGSEVKDFKEGDEVYSMPEPTRNGTYAEYVIVKAERVAAKPKSVDHVTAAAVPLAALTAWQGLFTYGRLEKSQQVLIHAASGGVGTFAVQFAKWKGAYVAGTTSAGNADLVKGLGADKVIDYRKEKFEEKIKDADLVLDTIGGTTQQRSLEVLKIGGRLITTLKAEDWPKTKQKNVHIHSFTAQSFPKDLEQIASLIDAGIVKPVVSKVLPLEQAAEAHKQVEEGHTVGKIVLKII